MHCHTDRRAHIKIFDKLESWGALVRMRKILSESGSTLGEDFADEYTSPPENFQEGFIMLCMHNYLIC